MQPIDIINRYKQDKGMFLERSKKYTEQYLAMLPDVPSPEELQTNDRGIYRLPLNLLEIFMCDPRYQNKAAFNILLTHTKGLQTDYDDYIKSHLYLVSRFIDLEFIQLHLDERVDVVKRLPPETAAVWLNAKAGLDTLGYFELMKKITYQDTDIPKVLDIFYRSHVPECIEAMNIFIYIIKEDIHNVKNFSAHTRFRVEGIIKDYTATHPEILAMKEYKTVKMTLALSDDAETYRHATGVLIDTIGINLCSE